MSRSCDGLQCLISQYFQTNHVASEEDKSAIIRVLEFSIRLNNVDQALINSVFEYFKNNKELKSSVIRILKVFLKVIDINGDNDVFITILNLAMEHDMFEILALLIKNGVDLYTLRSISGSSCAETMLHMILNRYNDADDEQKQEYDELISILISKETNVHRVIKNEGSSLNVAVMHKLMHILKFFEKSGVDFSYSDENGNSLHFLSKTIIGAKTYIRNCRWICREGHIRSGAKFREPNESANDESFNEIIDFLILQGCDVNAKDSSGSTPLHYAIREHKNGIARRLIMHGADVNRKRDDVKGFKPLHVAIIRYNVDIIETVVKAGAEINAKTASGETVIHLLMHPDDPNLVKMLVKLGANIYVRHKFGLFPLDRAIVYAAYKVAMELLKFGADINDSADLVVDNVNYQNQMHEIIEYLMKLKAAGLFLDERLQLYVDKHNVDQCKTKHNSYLKEIRALKSFKITSSTSLYDFLHMNSNAKCAYVGNEEILDLIDSPKFVEKFPNYHVLVMGSYLRAVRRRELLKSAKPVWYELTEVQLTDVCVRHILSYLSNTQLSDFIEGTAGWISNRSFSFRPIPRNMDRIWNF